MPYCQSKTISIIGFNNYQVCAAHMENNDIRIYGTWQICPQVLNWHENTPLPDVCGMRRMMACKHVESNKSNYYLKCICGYLTALTFDPNLGHSICQIIHSFFLSVQPGKTSSPASTGSTTPRLHWNPDATLSGSHPGRSEGNTMLSARKVLQVA